MATLTRSARTAAATPVPQVSTAGSGAVPEPAAGRLRRRPFRAVIALTVAAVIALIAMWLATAGSNSVAVLAVKTPVARGAVIQADNLTVAHIAPDPALNPLPASQSSAVVGQRAAADLSAGTLITSSAISPALVPAVGQNLVGVSLTPDRLPGSPLQPGDQVMIVDTPGKNATTATPAAPSITATVVGVFPQEDGRTVVDLTVPAANAAALAKEAANQTAALVLLSRER